MGFFKDFINQYGATILYTILTAAVTAIGSYISKLAKKYVDNETKRSVVTTCVKAVEQLYTDLHGQDKYNKAVEAITSMLGEKGIKTTDFEVKMLVESVCNDFVKAAQIDTFTADDVTGAEVTD